MEALSVSAASSKPAPGPRGLSGFFETFGYVRDDVHGMLRARQRYGGLVRLSFPGMMMYLINEPALIEHVFVTDNKNYGKDRFMRRMGMEVLGQGLLTSDGELWRKQRRLVQPAFHHARIAEYAETMVACGQEYLRVLESSPEREIQSDMMQLTLRVVLRTLLSIESDAFTAEISEAFAVITRHYDLGFWTILRARWSRPLPASPRFNRALRRVNEIVLDVIRTRRAADPRTGRTDILDMLLAAKDEEGNGISDQQLRDEVITMFSAGHETTALTLTFAFLLLSENPAVEAKLRDELASVLNGRQATIADVPQLRYTEAVVLETMRVYPPAWALGREALRDCELGGYFVPKGTQLNVSPWVVHRDPELFPEPEAFRPERWLDGLQKRLPRFGYMPFGGGPRQCIGNSFAMIESTLLLATILQRFRLHVSADSQPLKFVLSLTRRPSVPLRARVEPV